MNNIEGRTYNHLSFNDLHSRHKSMISMDQPTDRKGLSVVTEFGKPGRIRPRTAKATMNEMPVSDDLLGQSPDVRKLDKKKNIIMEYMRKAMF